MATEFYLVNHELGVVLDLYKSEKWLKPFSGQVVVADFEGHVPEREKDRWLVPVARISQGR